jgi:hypothetical protein
MPTHLLYIDDSGTEEYAASPDEYDRSGNTRYFVFGGVLIAQENIEALRNDIQRLKTEVFFYYLR